MRNIRHIFERPSHTGPAFSAGVAGALIGAAVTYYLLGTEAGARKRTKLARMAKKVKTRANELKEDIKETINDELDDMADVEELDEEEE